MMKTLARCLLAGSFLVAAGVAAAQSEARPFSRPTERTEAWLAYVKTALKITDAQSAQWNAFVDKVRQLAAEREGRMALKSAAEPKAGDAALREHPRLTAIERMEKAQQAHADAAKRIAGLLEVERPLYAALNSEQKKVADVVLSRPGLRGMAGHRGHGREGRRA